MKQIINWSEDYIENQFPFSETDWLELKGYRVIDCKNDNSYKINRPLLAKAVSAMANSGGGYIVLGINDKTKSIDNGGIPIDIKSNGTKEWLEDIVPTLIDPPLSQFNIHEIKSSSAKSLISSGHAIYVIDIENSNLAPHQSTFDNKYYHRAASRSQPSNHQIVMDMIGRSKYPIIKPDFRFAYVNSNKPNLLLRAGEHKVIDIILKNDGRILAEYVNIILLIPKYLIENSYALYQNLSIREKEHIKYYKIIKENVISETTATSGEILSRNPGRYSLILPGREHSFTIPIVHKGDFDLDSSYTLNAVIYWELYADNMPPNIGSIVVNEIKLDKTLPWK